MPRPRTQKIYFGEDQEKAVVNYLESSDDAEKNKIFNEYLREPLGASIFAAFVTAAYIHIKAKMNNEGNNV